MLPRQFIGRILSYERAVDCIRFHLYILEIIPTGSIYLQVYIDLTLQIQVSIHCISSMQTMPCVYTRNSLDGDLISTPAMEKSLLESDWCYNSCA